MKKNLSAIIADDRGAPLPHLPHRGSGGRR